MSFLEDAAKSVVGKALLGAALPFWGGTLIDYLGGTNSILGRTAEVALTTTPGLVQGESFTQAFTSAYALRLKMVADYYSFGTADQVINKAYEKVSSDPSFRKAVSDVIGKQAGQDLAEGLRQAGFAPEDVAKKYDVRPDVAAMAVNGQAHQNVHDLSDFDIPNGRREYRLLGKQLESTRLAVELAKAVRSGRDPASVQQIRQAYVNALAKESAPKPPRTAGYILEQWHRAEQMFGPDSKIALAFKAQYQDELARTKLRDKADPSTPISVAFGTKKSEIPVGEAARKDKSVLRDLLTFGILTSPAWLVLAFHRFQKARHHV